MSLMEEELSNLVKLFVLWRQTSPKSCPSQSLNEFPLDSFCAKALEQDCQDLNLDLSLDSNKIFFFKYICKYIFEQRSVYCSTKQG